MYQLGIQKGYSLIATNKNGNNAFFVKNELLNQGVIKSKKPKDCYNINSFSENLDNNGNVIKDDKLERELIEKYPFVEV